MHLQKYEKDFPIVKDYLEYKKLYKMVSSYGRKFLKYVHNKTGRVHTDFFQIKHTGRLSSTKPNLQNIPGESRPGFRECFRTEPGWKMVVADYSQQELRVMADISKDKAMCKFYTEDTTGDPDLHSFTATKMFHVKVSRNENKPLRTKGKITNFTISYGGGAAKIAKAFGISIKEAANLIKSFFSIYKDLKVFFDRKTYETLKNGYVTIDEVTNRICYIDDYPTYLWCKHYIKVQNLAGRSVHPKIWTTFNRLQSKMRRLSQNYPIQGTSGSMTKLAAVFFREWIQKNSLWNVVKMVNVVHDEIVVECKEILAPKVKKELLRCMEAAGKVFCDTVPIIADCVISDYHTH